MTLIAKQTTVCFLGPGTYHQEAYCWPTSNSVYQPLYPGLTQTTGQLIMECERR